MIRTYAAAMLLGAALIGGGCAGLSHQPGPDVNYYPITGDAAGSLWVNGVQVRQGPLPVYELASIRIDLPAAEAAKYNDLLKLSRVVNLVIDDVYVSGQGAQQENAWDSNFECRNVTVRYAWLWEGRQNAITIKGGCQGVHFGVVQIKPGAGDCDAELGGASDQSQARTTDITFDSITMTDGRTCYIRVYDMRSDPPQIAAGPVQIGTVHSSTP